MRHLFQFTASFVTILVGIVGVSICRGETDPDNKQAEQGIVGPWHADSVALLSEKGAKKVLPTSEQKPFSIVISDTSLIMRVGDEKFAEMSYVSDAKQTPATIDVKFQDQDMPGIYELQGDSLKISLNDAKKGRPKDFGQEDTDMELALHRFDDQPLFMINADGTNLQPFAHMPEYTKCVTPEWSRDGSKIAFDARRSVFGEPWQSSHVFTVNADGTSIKDLGNGVMPSWSRDGKQIAYLSFSDGGVWVMNADGSDKHLIEQRGWSPHWSPTKDELAYAVPGPDGENICVLDLKTNTRRNLLDNRNTRIMWDLCWSPDGQSICFMDRLQDNSSELAIVSAEGQTKGFKILLPDKAIPEVKRFECYVSWRPDGKHILTSMIVEGNPNNQLYLLDPEGKTPPQKIAGQDATRNNRGMYWSPDGKRIVFASAPGKPAENKASLKTLLNRIFSVE